MINIAIDPKVKAFLNDKGIVVSWPAKLSKQRLLLAYLATKFATKNVYTEKEVNALLQEWHTFGDWATLRRGLIDEGLLQRKSDGTEYRRL